MNYEIIISGFCIVCFFQTARDIESKLRSEARLKLFMLDPDTQVMDALSSIFGSAIKASFTSVPFVLMLLAW